MTSPYFRLRPRARLRYAFPAARHRNFRLFLFGQFVSFCGTWMQTVAHGWLVLELTNSPFQVGLVTALGTLPILLLTLYGGVIADRINKRRAVILLQSLMLCEALTLGILTATDHITVPWVMVLAVFFGLLSAFEVPARQAFVADLVGRTDLMNAIALNSSAFNVARVIGPVVAGAVIATAGLAVCFFANAASYLAVLTSLFRMRVEDEPVARDRLDLLTSFREGVRYVVREPWPRAIMALTASFSIFGYSFMPMLPVYAKNVLGMNASGYGLIVSAVGIGAVGGALFLAGFGRNVHQARLALTAATAFGAALVSAALAPRLITALICFTAAGCMMALNGIAGNTILQRLAPDALRGRVMGFYSFVVLGLAPFGSIQAGWISEHYGVRVSFGVGGAVCVVAAAFVARTLRRHQSYAEVVG